MVTLTGCGKSDKPNPPDDKKGGTNVPPPGPTDPPKPPSDPKLPVDTGLQPPHGAEEDLTSAKPDLIMTAKEFDKQFGEGSGNKEAQLKAVGKVVELSGTVKRIENAKRQPPTIYFGDDRLWVIACAADPRFWEVISPGSEVTIRGRVADLESNSVGTLYSVVIVKTGPNPTEVMAAVAFAKEFKTDLKSWKSKRVGKLVYVEGEFKAFKPRAIGNGFEFTLAGEVGCDVVCEVRPSEEERLKLLQAGQKMKVLGKVYAPSDTNPTLDVLIFSAR